MFKRGNVGPSNILVPTQRTSTNSNDFINADRIKIDGRIFDERELSSQLRFNGTKRFFQCVDILFEKNEPLVFVEVGGCTGRLIRHFTSYDSKSKIFCVEPNSLLSDRLSAEFGDRVDVENIGLGSQPGKGKLHITRRPQFSSQLSPDQNYADIPLIGIKNKYKDGSLEVESVEEFNIRTGDEYFSKKGIFTCDILSLNTQGSEVDILNGLVDTLKRGVVKAFKIEVDMQHRYQGAKDSSLADIERIMSANDYRIFDILLIKQMNPVGIQMMDILYVHKNIDFHR